MKLAWSMVVVAVVGTTVACGNSLAPDQSVILGVYNVDAPSAVSAGQTINLVLSVELGGCLKFDRIDVQGSATGADVTAWGKDVSIGRKGITCTSDLKLEPHSVELKPPFQNPYTVMVNRGRISPFVITVQVN